MVVNDPGETSQADSEILHPASRALFRFWEAMRGERSAPSRKDLDLAQIRDMVPNLAIIGRGPDGFHWRLAGTAVCNLYRSQLTGSAVLVGWDHFETDVVGRFLSGVVDRLQPCLLRFRMKTDASQLIGVEMLGLPLQASDGKAIHVFGGLFPFRETSSMAYEKIAGIELSGARSIWTTHLPGDALVREIQGRGSRPFLPYQVIQGGRTH